MVNTQSKAESRAVRHKRLRSKVVGTTVRPRLAVFRSNRFVYAQIINDETGTTLAAVDSRTQKSGTALERAVIVGTEIAAKAKAAGVTSVVFDRGGFRYQGIIAALADGARQGGLTF